jgi:hypothetical protein
MNEKLLFFRSLDDGGYTDTIGVEHVSPVVIN